MQSEAVKWSLLNHAVAQQRAGAAYAGLSEAGVRCFLIKGVAAAINYPRPEFRVFQDVDICVNPDQFTFAQEYLKRAKLGFGVDLHRGLRHYHHGEFEEVYGRAVSVELAGNSVLIPAPEDHLVILATHWLNDGGARQDRLDDIRFLLSASTGFDWESLGRNIPHNRRRWLEIVLLLAVEQRGLNAELIPFFDEIKTPPSWFRPTLEREWAGGSLEPLYYANRDIAAFRQQLRRRFPPNPITATVESDGDLDSWKLPLYQLLSFLRRVPKGVAMQLSHFRKT